MDAPAVTVVIPSYNRCEILRRVLAALEAQVLAPGDRFEVIVVDDCSTDGTAAFLAAHRARRYALSYRVAPTNAGPARARNEAVALATGGLILFTGDDVVPHRHFVGAHLATHRRLRDPRVAVLGRTMWPDCIPVTTVMAHVDGIGAQQFSYRFLRDGSYVDFRHLYTSNVSLPLALLREEGKLFDLDFPHAAYEDVELGLRLSRRGMRIYYTRDALGFHHHPYTVYGFCDRQHRAGLMALVLATKHPETRELIGISDVERVARQPARLIQASIDAWFEGAGDLGIAEAAALRLAAFYEMRDVPPLDVLYLGLFRYFYDKGIADALREGRERDSLRRRLFVRDLAPALDHFVQDADRLALPVPEDVMEYLSARRFVHPRGLRRSLWRRIAGRLSRAWVSA